jgi:hypothetical protein
VPEFFEVRVAARPDERSVELELQAVTVDARRLPSSLGFALQLLHEPAPADAPLATVLDHDTVTSDAWAKAHARAFIESVELLSLVNDPPPEARRSFGHPYWRSFWKDASSRLAGRLRIRVTHPAWLEHLHGSWRSRVPNSLVDPASSYADCPPASPGACDELVLDGDPEHPEGFVPVPRLLVPNNVDAACPELLWFPRHGVRAYAASERWVGGEITLARLAMWRGRPVIFHEALEGETRVGVVAGIEGEHVVLISLTNHDGWVLHCAAEDLAWIGPAAFRRDTRWLTPVLELEPLLSGAIPAAVLVQVEGCMANIQVFELSRAGTTPKLANASDILRLIAIPASEYGRLRATTKLGEVLRRHDDHGSITSVDFYPDVATELIASFEVEPPTAPRTESLDTLDRARLREFITQRRWPKWTVRVVVHDAAWLEHLLDAQPWPFVGPESR